LVVFKARQRSRCSKNRGKNEIDDHSRKPLFKPPNGKSKAKWKGKEKKTMETV